MTDEQTRQTTAISFDDLLIEEEGFNSRRENITPYSVKNLQEDMAKNGLDQPIHVKRIDHPKYKFKVIAGFRRSMSAKWLGWKSIPAFIRDDLKDEQAERIFNIRENMQRKDLSLIDQAYAIKPFLAKYASAQWIADKLGLSKRWISYLILVGKLDPSIQKEIEANPTWFKQGHIERMVEMKLPDAQKYVHDIKAHASRGEKLKIRKPKQTRLSDKSRRTVQEINDLLETVYDAFEPGIETRLLAWAAGNISNIDIIRDLQVLAIDRDKTYIPPESFGMI